MILSMTGYGAAEHVDGGVNYRVELRSLNHRYLKISIKLPEFLQSLESDIEGFIRGRIARGSVTCTIRVRDGEGMSLRPVNRAAVQHYVDELCGVRIPPGASVSVDLATIATFPGVCEPTGLDDAERQSHLAALLVVVGQAADGLVAMRRQEGESLRSDVDACCNAISETAAKVAARSPVVVDEYHERLKARVETLMKKGGFDLAADGLAREVAIYAERCDIGEEISRLASHLEQFNELCDRGEQVGRTLDFLTQELLREANTIASKSNDRQIARHVVEIKGWIDRLKEQVQNVE